MNYHLLYIRHIQEKMMNPNEMPSIVKDILQDYIEDSNEAVEMKLVRKSEDIEDSTENFYPEMSHQIYGDSEQIFGYCGLKVKLYYTASTLTTYLSHTYQEKVDPSKFEGVTPDDVIKPIAEKIPPGYLSNIEDFRNALDKESNFKPFGEMEKQYITKRDGVQRTFEIYYHDITPAGFLNYHKRLQTFLLWFIDASSYIDVDDDRWRFFLMYEKYKVNGDVHYAIAGYSTVYEYYAYPAHIRPRISQMLILPTFQRDGLGSQLLQAIYDHYKGNPLIVDITVEDPSMPFQLMRDFVDCRNCLKLGILSKDKITHDLDLMACEAKATLKLNKTQFRRVFEIVRLCFTYRNDQEQYQKYRLFVKNRLASQYKKEDAMMKKLKRALSPEELVAANITSSADRLEALSTCYKGLEEQYTIVVDKIATEGLAAVCF